MIKPLSLCGLSAALALAQPVAAQVAPPPSGQQPPPIAALPDIAGDPVQPGPPDRQPPALAAPDAAPAQPARPNRLLNEWGGMRPKLRAAGITPTVAYVGQLVGNVRGGKRRTARFGGQLAVGAALDLARIAGLPGTVEAVLTRRHGTNITAASGLVTLVTPHAIIGRGEIWRVSELSYQVDIGRLDLKLGRIQLNDDFDLARCDFINGLFCTGQNVRVAPVSWPQNPISQWGVRGAYQIAERVTAKAGVMQYNPRNLDADRPMYVGWSGEGTGIIMPAELEWRPQLAGDALPGTYSIGLVYLDGAVEDAVLNEAGQLRSVFGGEPLMRRAQWGGYATARQQLRSPAADGSGLLSLFANVSVWSRRTARNQLSAAVGANYTGLISGRPQDEVGVAVGLARVNDRVTEAVRAANALTAEQDLVPTTEYAAEAYYGVTLLPGLVVRPGLQLILDPGGSAHRRNAVLLECRINVVL